MSEIYLLSLRNWLQSLELATAVLADGKREVFFLDPERVEEENDALLLLTVRLPLSCYNLTGSEAVNRQAAAAGLRLEADPLSGRHDIDAFKTCFGIPAGICAAAADSLADCLKAAMLAVRLGYYFVALPTESKTILLNDAALPLVWIGTRQAAAAAEIKADRRNLVVIEDDCRLLKFLESAGLDADYLVVYNSADLLVDTVRGSALRRLWVRGLSLHLLTLASYRPVFPFDVQSEKPDPELIENNLHQMVELTGLKPRFQAVLASPAAVPFFYEEKKMIGAVTEEMVRDIHLRLNDDLFFDLAEGRLMQNSCGGLSTQIISTKRYNEVQQVLQRGGRDLLIVATPHVETGIIFSTDDALIDTQLVPLLEDAGFAINQLRDRDAGYLEVAAALKETDYFLYTGHGGPEGLHTHGRTLNRGDLPLLPPLVAYASACSTVGLVPHWYSPDEGLTWKGVPVDSRQVIGLSFVEKGAICFVGGATIEDLQYTTSTYSVFMEALLLKGLSVGEAVREIRHVISLYSATLLQKNPEAYRKYRWGTANAIHQQILLGDPAFVPAAKKYTAAALPVSLAGEAPLQTLTVEIPEDRWQRGEAAVHKLEASKYYYRCCNIEAITPYGEDIFSWGDYYRVAPDARNISEWAVKSTFLHLTHLLPSGMVPQKLSLIAAETGESECLLCGEAAEGCETPLEAMRKFKLPYLLQPPIELNMQEGWAFCTEDLGDSVRMRWLVPLLLIDDLNRSAFPLKKFVFQIESVPEVKFKGKIANADPASSYVVCAGYQGETGAGNDFRGQPFCMTAAALSTKEGSFSISCAPDSALTIRGQFPLYDLLEKYQPFEAPFCKPRAENPVKIELQQSKYIDFKGFVYDSLSGEPLEGALIRVFRGEHDPVGDLLIEAYAGEAVTGHKGDFQIKLPSGNYLVYGAATFRGRRYKSAEWVLKLRRGDRGNRIYALDQAGIVRGRVTFDGYQPPDPAQVALKRFPKVEGAASLTKVPVDRDGSYECLVSYQDSFQIVLEEEGRKYIYDDHEGEGYRLEPQQILERNYCLLTDIES
jgi:hypothetical protein